MSVVFEDKRFSRVGRQSGTKKIIKDAEGNDKEVYVDENGSVIDNTYIAKQIKADSLNISDGASLLTDFLEVADGSLEKVRDYFVSGANQHLRLEAGGFSPEEKVAKALLKNLPGQFEGVSMAQLIELVKGLKK